MFETIRYAYHSARMWNLVDKRNRCFFEGDIEKARRYDEKADDQLNKLQKILWGKRA